MTSFSDPDYIDTKLIKQGHKQLTPLFQELADWINQEFNSHVINVYYDTHIVARKVTPRLRIIFEHNIDAAKFKDKSGCNDASKQQVIATRFRQILTEHSTKRNLLERLFRKSYHSIYHTENITIVFPAFEETAIEEVNSKIPKTEIENLEQELSSKNVWKIYQQFGTATYFFYTKEQVDVYTNDGSTGKLEVLFLNLLKKYDEFNYISKDNFIVRFDSKERFDTEYDGNWFAYSRNF